MGVENRCQLENLYKKENIVQFIKSIRMQRGGHAWRAGG